MQVGWDEKPDVVFTNTLDFNLLYLRYRIVAYYLKKLIEISLRSQSSFSHYEM